MNCSHCQTWNDQYEHRCHRCARKLSADCEELEPVGASASTRSSYARGGATAVLLPPERPTALPAPSERLLRHMSPDAVAYAPVASEHLLSAPDAGPGTLALLTHPGGDFHIPQTFRPAPDSSPETVIHSEMPRAHPLHRILACALDASLMIIASGVFILTLHFGGFGFSRAPLSLALVGLGVALIVFAYRALWAVAGTDSPGMHWTHMRLIDFEGNRPARSQRFVRLFASALSLMSCGLGLIWTLVDDEELSWHDHLSRTYPTVRN